MAIVPTTSTAIVRTMTVVAVVLAVALPAGAVAQSPIPAPESGAPLQGPSAEVGPAAPGPVALGPAAAGPGGLDCFSYLVNLSDCLTYVEAESNETKPDPMCCPELAGLVDSQPICLCQLLGSNVGDSFGIKINRPKALNLPSVCGVQTPPISLCAVAGYPIDVPGPSVAPSATGGIPPESGNSSNGVSSIAVSQLSFLVGLAVAFINTLLF
ncbi:hypothetical protein U1Q18_032391 [Sarracenia purpurea var. burkii]